MSLRQLFELSRIFPAFYNAPSLAPYKKQLTCLFVESGYPRFRLSPPLLHFVPQRLRRRYYPSRTIVTIASFVLAICTALDQKDDKSE
jgi:hypothetical protein